MYVGGSINPKFTAKIKSLDVPPSVKKILIDTLEVEQDLRDEGSSRDIIKYYDRKLTEYVKDMEVVLFCDKYER
jgi:hypothetical protein